MEKKYRGPLHEMALTTKTDYWNDSCSINELSYAIENGAVGATTNPVIVKNVLKAELENYEEQVKELIANNPEATEDEIAWVLIENMAVEGAKLLKPVFDPETGRGRISIQTNTKYYRNSELLIEQALHFSDLAENIQVKIPATSAGIKAFEESTYRGVSINATVSFTVPQAIAVAEAVERGLNRREKEGLDNSHINPVCTIMVGRVDDWLKDVANRDHIITNPEYLEWAGVAVMKNAYNIFQERGYKTKLLAAAYRNHHQWSQFIGGDILETIPYKWQKRFNGSNIEVKERIDDSVAPEIIDELLYKFDDFKKAYLPEGMGEKEFDNYGAVTKTLLQFSEGYDELVSIIRGYMLIVR
jgi:transaldolase